ncbi:MAG: tetratricopeptide repeat protein [Ketobacter sp.]|nr:tetratricopeptide repeat protein [Ketobacter sp.]
MTDAQHLTKAQEYIEADDVKAATIELKNALQKNPKNARARFLLGKLHLEAGNPAGAEKELSRASELGMEDKKILPLLSQALFQQGKSDEVLNLSGENLSADEQAEVLATQGLAHLAKRNIDEAEALIEKALAADATSIPVLMAAARLYSIKQASEKARKSLDAVIQSDPQYVPAWSLLGDIELRDQHLEQAVSAYTKAIDLSKNNLPDRLKRALVLIPQQKYEKAQSDLDLLMQQAPQHVGVNYA